MSDKLENTESPDETPTEAPLKPLEVKVTNTPTKDSLWNDARDDLEYDDLGITEEDMNI